MARSVFRIGHVTFARFLSSKVPHGNAVSLHRPPVIWWSLRSGLCRPDLIDFVGIGLPSALSRKAGVFPERLFSGLRSKSKRCEKSHVQYDDKPKSPPPCPYPSSKRRLGAALTLNRF